MALLKVLKPSIDSILWVPAVFLGAFLRLDFDWRLLEVRNLLVFAAVLAVVNLLAGRKAGLYNNRNALASFGDLVSLILAVAFTISFGLAGMIIFGPAFGIPRSLPVLAGTSFVFLAGGWRALYKWSLLVRFKPTDAKRTLVYGAGEIAEALIPQLLKDPTSKYLPVGLIDDAPDKANRWIRGVKMKGSIDSFSTIVRSTRATALIVAISRVTAPQLQQIYDLARRENVEVAILPNLSDLLSNTHQVPNISKLSLEDLIGRRAVAIDSESVALELKDKVVLVTGAGGSIGMELCRQISKFDVKELIFLDRDETGLQQAQLISSGHGLLNTKEIVLADIRDGETLENVFNERRPDIVFHAAALKHLPVLESFPLEAWKTNVLGTLNVLEAAKSSGVDIFVNISTDKAADPSSVLGRSKLLAEQLTAWFGHISHGKFVSVRFGNVLGSRGSLVPTVSTLIEMGKPITITHPDATRYFMTTPEACQLVLQATVLRNGGDVFILNMGEPVRILDVVLRILELAGSTVRPVFTGLRKGEKLHEELHSSGLPLEDSGHPLIWQIKSEKLNPENLGPQLLDGDRAI